MHTYYQVLEISRHAGPQEIKDAYRALARRYHPDVNKNPEAEPLMRIINQAYEVLSDPIRKAQYDRQFDAQQVSSPWAIVPADPAGPVLQPDFLFLGDILVGQKATGSFLAQKPSGAFIGFPRVEGGRDWLSIHFAMTSRDAAHMEGTVEVTTVGLRPGPYILQVQLVWPDGQATLGIWFNVIVPTPVQPQPRHPTHQSRSSQVEPPAYYMKPAPAEDLTPNPLVFSTAVVLALLAGLTLAIWWWQGGEFMVGLIWHRPSDPTLLQKALEGIQFGVIGDMFKFAALGFVVVPLTIFIGLFGWLIPIICALLAFQQLLTFFWQIAIWVASKVS